MVSCFGSHNRLLLCNWSLVFNETVRNSFVFHGIVQYTSFDSNEFSVFPISNNRLGNIKSENVFQ